MSENGLCPRCKERRKETASGYCKKCHNKRSLEYYYEHKEEKRALSRRYYLKNRDIRLSYGKKWREKLRLDVLIHYSGNPPKCACCGESYIEFLTVDHINGGGVKHRKKVGITGTFFYRWLKKNSYPKEFRVLCYNCNCSIGHYGYCPHEKRGEILV